MFEHAGGNQLPSYFQHAYELLRPGGVFLNHGIALPKGPNFISRYVFPEGDLMPINVSLRYAEAVGFEVRDVESLREHYALTLRHWARRLERHRDQALATVGEPTYRVWRLFLPGSVYGFTSGALNAYQALLVNRSRPERLTVNSHRLVSPYYVGRVSVGGALVIRHWLWPLVRHSVTPPQLPRTRTTTTRTIPTPFTALLH
jgi:Mycolic acid cyclopropane synthetase